jgi:hypothetical protein
VKIRAGDFGNRQTPTTPSSAMSLFSHALSSAVFLKLVSFFKPLRLRLLATVDRDPGVTS